MAVQVRVNCPTHQPYFRDRANHHSRFQSIHATHSNFLYLYWYQEDIVFYRYALRPAYGIIVTDFCFEYQVSVRFYCTRYTDNRHVFYILHTLMRQFSLLREGFSYHCTQVPQQAIPILL